MYLINEIGFSPIDLGFDDDNGMDESDDDSERGGEPADEELSGIEQILNSIEGFWNKEEHNFTIGGTRVKTIIKKNFQDGEYSNASEDDVKYVMKKVSKLDPSEQDQEQNDVLRLAGVNTNEPDDNDNDDGQSIELLMKELSRFGKRRKFDSIDKHKMNRMMRNNNEKVYRNRSFKFR